jgi:ribonuclease HI
MSGLKTVTIYTDGACSGNPGPGGWAAILEHGGREKEIAGGEAATTNNRMEMQAVIEALKILREPCHVRLHSDSALVVNAFTQGWIERWIANGWKRADKKPVENKALWEEMIRVMAPHKVEWIKVKAHHDDEINNRVDALAVAESRRFLT